MKICLHRNRRLRVCFTLTLLALVSGTVAADDLEMWVQRWGILDGNRLCDYDAKSGQLLNSYRDCAVLWDVKSGLALRRYLPLADSSRVTHEGCILDQQILLGGTHFVSLLNKQNGQLIRSFDLEGNQLNSLTTNKGSILLAASTLQGKLYIWDIETGRRLHAIDAQRILAEMEFSPDSRLLLCGSDEHVATLWNVETGELHDRLNAPTDVRHVAFSDDGRRMLTAGFGMNVRTPRLIVWDVGSLVPQQIIPRTAMDASFAGENVRIVLPSGEVEFWSPDRHEDPPPPSEPSPEHEGDFRLAGITRNHWFLRSPRDNSQLTLIGPDSNESIVEVHPETPRFTADDHFPLAISKDGGWLLTGGASHGNRPDRSAIWNLRDGKIQLELENEFLGAFHPDGKSVVLAREGKLTVLNVETGETLRTLDVNDERYWGGRFTSLRFTHDGKRLLAAHGDWYDGDAGAIFLWDLESGELLRNYATGTKAVILAEMSRDEKWILAALTPGNDGSAGIDQLSVIDAETGEFKTTRMFNNPGFNTWPVSDVTGLVATQATRAISDGKFCDGENTLFALTDLSPKTHLPEFSRPSVFSPDGQIIACFEPDHMLSFRATDTGSALHAYKTQLHSMRPLLFHPNQRLICGALFDPWHIQESSAVGVGFEDILTGELEAELTLFREPGSWLITTRDGAVNGATKPLSRVTWRRSGSIRVIRDPARTQQVVNPQRVAEAVSQSLPAGESIHDCLKRMPEPVIPESHVQEPPGNLWFKNYQVLEREAVKAFREAGADVEINLHNRATSIHLEQRSVTDDLLKQLLWTHGLDRLYVAAMGIHDAQLDEIGLLSSLKRLSLWGNPITDRGLTQLSGLWNLEVLDVHDTQVTAVGLNALRMLPNLKTVIVPESILIDDLASLRERHPNLEIIRRSGNR